MYVIHYDRPEVKGRFTSERKKKDAKRDKLEGSKHNRKV